MISYSNGSRRALARLFRPYNDFDVYVEDSTLIGVYERIINRVLGSSAQVSRVIPLGPRQVVLHAAAEANPPIGRYELYLVDGDLDLMCKWRHKKLNNLHRLKVYSVENLVIEDSSIENMISYCLPSRTKASALASVKPDHLKSEVRLELKRYFIFLAIAHRLNLRGGVFSFNPPSVSYAVNNKWIGPSRSKISTRCKDLLSEILRRVGIRKYKEAKNDVKGIIAARAIDVFELIPAREFYLYYLRNRINNAGGATSSIAAVSYLADNCKLSKDTILRSRLRKIGRQIAT